MVADGFFPAFDILRVLQADFAMRTNNVWHIVLSMWMVYVQEQIRWLWREMWFKSHAIKKQNDSLEVDLFAMITISTWEIAGYVENFSMSLRVSSGIYFGGGNFVMCGKRCLRYFTFTWFNVPISVYVSDTSHT